jgi:hypothetical protein
MPYRKGGDTSSLLATALDPPTLAIFPVIPLQVNLMNPIVFPQ